MTKQYVHLAPSMKQALDASQEMETTILKWAEQFPNYSKKIEIEEVEDELPYMVTLTISTDEDTET